MGSLDGLVDAGVGGAVGLDRADEHQEHLEMDLTAIRIELSRYTWL